MTEQEILTLCTQEGLDQNNSNILVACVHVESNFNQYAINLNKTAAGLVSSIDFGICQINDFWWIGAGKQFPSIEYVLSNPQACITWMISLFKEGKQDTWVSYSSGAYKKYMPA